MILHGDSMKIIPTLPAAHFHTCVTSPPYWGLRDYGIPPTEWPEVTYTPMPGLPPITVPEWTGCLGLEPTPEMFVAHIVLVFRGVWRVLREDGTLWLNFGDSYVGGPRRDEVFNERYHGKHYLTDEQGDIDRVRPGKGTPSGLKRKDMIGIPWRVAFALQADGWYLRMDNVWGKPNCMPESTRDRPTRAHEYVFLLAKSERYYYDGDSIKEPMAASSISRLSQDIEHQSGSSRANGGAKTNGNMKAVGGSKGAFGPPQSRARAKGNARTFRGGGKYTNGQSFDNSKAVDRQSKGNDPIGTVTTRDRFGLVTIHGQDYAIVDIGMRMLEPHELFAAQGFPPEYRIDRDHEGKKYPKSAQVARCGNSVSPVHPKYMVRANLPEMCGAGKADVG